MLKTVFRDWLGIIDQDREIEDLKRKIQDIEDQLQQERNLTETEIGEMEENIEEIKQAFYESRPATADLSKKERQLLEVFLQEDKWKDKEDLAESMDITKDYVSTLVSRLREKIEVEEKKVDKIGRKAYKLSEEERDRIDQGF
jgi:DNA-binding CsgD family transcriptional regulator